MDGSNSSVTSLRSFVDRLVRLEEQKKEIAADIKDVRSEVRSCGFDVKVVAQMVKETLMDNEQRAAQREYEEICELYRASLGMLGGTPLGEAARRRASKEVAQPEDNEGAEGQDTTPAEDLDPPTEDVDAARERGRDAGRQGAKIFTNPYVSGDPRRAAWDEGWCEATGSDGMDLPDSWRRKKKPEKKDDQAGEDDR